MKVSSPTQQKTTPSGQGMAYLQAAVPDFSGLVRGASQLGDSIAAQAKVETQKKDQLNKFKAASSFIDFQTASSDFLNDRAKTTALDESNFRDRVAEEHHNYTEQFISTLPKDLQDEFRVRANETHQTIVLKAQDIQEKNNTQYYKDGIDTAHNDALIKVNQDPNSLEAEKARIDELIKTSGLNKLQQDEMLRQNAKTLEGIAYKKAVAETHKGSNNLVSAVNEEANRYGYNVEDVLTVMGYETGGRYSTSTRGGKNNMYVGLIQFGPAEQKKYGVYQGQPVKEQVHAAMEFLHDRGFRPGMSILDMYSTINAGSPGHYNASDGPGNTVASHVAEMGAHREKARALLRGEGIIPDELDNNPRYANVPFEDRVNLREQAATDARQSIAADFAAQRQKETTYTNTLMNGILDGTQGKNDVDEAYRLGLITDYDNRNKAYNAIAERDKASIFTQETKDKLSGNALWDSSDPNDKKRSDAWYGRDGTKAAMAADENYFSNTLMPFVEKTHMIPPQAVADYTSLIKSNDQKQQLFALNALSNLEQTAPEVYRAQVPEATQKTVDKWYSLRNTADPKTLFESLRGGETVQDRTARAALEKQAEKFFTNTTDPNHVDFTSVLNHFTPDVLGPNTVPTSPGIASAASVMESEWQSLLKENYVAAQGNWQAAQDMTLKQLDRTWGTTSIGGQLTLMKHPPEKSGVPMIEGKYDWIELQAREELKIPADTNFELISDDQTRNELASGKPPSYQIATVKDGVWEYKRDDNNVPVRQFFKPTNSMVEFDKVEFQKKQLYAERDRVANQLMTSRKIIPGIDPERDKLVTEWHTEFDALTKRIEALIPHADALRKNAFPSEATLEEQPGSPM